MLCTECDISRGSLPQGAHEPKSLSIERMARETNLALHTVFALHVFVSSLMTPMPSPILHYVVRMYNYNGFSLLKKLQVIPAWQFTHGTHASC